MASLFAELHKGLRESVTLVVEKTAAMGKNIRHHVDVLGLKREIERLFYELGGRTFELLSHHPEVPVAQDPEVQELFLKLQALEEQLAASEAEQSPPAPAPPIS